MKGAAGASDDPLPPSGRLPSLPPRQQGLVQEGIRLFNQERFFECHEVLEEAWLETSGEWRRFLQGLIQVAVAFHHLRRGNSVGARRLLTAGTKKLSETDRGRDLMDVEALLEALEPLRQQAQAGEVPSGWPSPRIVLKNPFPE